jgi:general secretion pathway protein K
MTTHPFIKRKTERGIALVSVLWVLSLLSMIAAAAISTSRLFATLERSAVRGAEMDAIVEAGLSRGVLGIIDKRPEQRWRVDGLPQKYTFNGAQLQISVQDELGKFDLNAVDEQQIKSIFASVGIDSDTADTLASRVVAWRSPESGSESEDSLRRPRHAPFQSIDEVKLVEGIGQELFAKIEPAITVHSRRPTIDPEIAPRAALLALPGVDPDRVDEIIEARIKGDADADLDSRPGVLDVNVPLSGRVFTITVEAVGEGARARRTAVVLITTDPKRPYLVLDWR